MMMDATNKLLVTEQLRRTHSSPIPPLHNDAILVKVLIPSLDCSKIFRLNPHNVNYEPLVKSLIIAKVCMVKPNCYYFKEYFGTYTKISIR